MEFCENSVRRSANFSGSSTDSAPLSLEFCLGRVTGAGGCRANGATSNSPGRSPGLGIPKGCEKVARGKRSAAPGWLRKRSRVLKGRRSNSVGSIGVPVPQAVQPAARFEGDPFDRRLALNEFCRRLDSLRHGHGIKLCLMFDREFEVVFDGASVYFPRANYYCRLIPSALMVLLWNTTRMPRLCL
jgi:hypothetical protein